MLANFFKMNDSFLASCLYFELFGVPFPIEQVERYAFQSGKSVDFRTFWEARYAKSSFLESAVEKQKLAALFWRKVESWRWLFQLCPFLDLVAVCNSLPLGILNQESDIDLFIVARPGRLFLARSVVTILSSLFGIRRHGKKIRKRFCLSFFVDGSCLDLSGIALQPQDIYLAYWMRGLEPINGEWKIYEAFLQKNEKWLKDYFSLPFQAKQHFKERPLLIRWGKSVLEALLDWDFLENILRDFQLKRIQQKLSQSKTGSGVVANEKMLKFHEKDARAQIQADWLKALDCDDDHGRSAS